MRPLHPLFAAEVEGIDLRRVDDGPTLAQLRDAMDAYAVCVVREQQFEDDEQMAFARRFDGELNTKTGRGAVEGDRRRLAAREMTDISNLDEYGKLLAGTDRRRVQALANRLWHTDASFASPPGRYSMLSARGALPPSGGETEYADMRAAYDALPEELKAEIADLRAHHSIVYSRMTIGFDEFTPEQRARLPGAEQPLVRTNPRTGRKALYVASHASHIVGWPVPEGRILLKELVALATLPQFVYRHAWRPRDFVIWDNLATMHRGLAFDERYPRDLRRVTTVDREPSPLLQPR
ncbi:MAG: TauD/TfdA family dioxygenase [Candidatus Eremiobacteraeota bacterium]|nr:TauD/TfdA family dioxygenase [Candidatus Eremiobacteraeota bacterium]